jgi:hypothetical protein
MSRLQRRLARTCTWTAAWLALGVSGAGVARHAGEPLFFGEIAGAVFERTPASILGSQADPNCLGTDYADLR